MKFTRRNILQAGGMAAGGLMLPRRGSATAPTGLLAASPQAAGWWGTRFTTSVPIPPVFTPVVGTGNNSAYPGYQYYKVQAKQFTQQMRGMTNGTRFWGYDIVTNPAVSNSEALGRTQAYLGGIIIGRTGTPIKLEVENCLTGDGTPTGTALPLHCVRNQDGGDVVDPTIAGSPNLYGASVIPGGDLKNRITVHLHGGDPLWDSDGHPLTWFSNDPATVHPGDPHGYHGQYWASGTSNTNTGTIYTYPNNLSARLLWYHDHAESLTRMNAYAGLATGYLLRDDNEDALRDAGKLPPYIEKSLAADIMEYPLVIQEKMFMGSATTAELYYHCVYDPSRWSVASGFPTTTGVTPGDLPYPSCVPEFFGDVALVNGEPWPKLDVKQGVYRFRILNASQARFYNLALYEAKNGADFKDIPDFTKPGPKFLQIGTEGGFLPAAVYTPKIVLGPAERVDILINFAGLAGKRYILYGAAPAPYPGGDPINDYIMDPAGISGPGMIMEFNCVAGALNTGTPDHDNAFAMPTTPWPPTGFNLWPVTTYKPAALGGPQAIMPVTLNEGWDDHGRLTQYIGNFTPTTAQEGFYGREFLYPTGQGLPELWESHKTGQIEEWSLVNTTGDVHPMHFHIVNVQIISRQAIDMNQFMTNAQIRPVGPAMAPDPNERGWKETVRCYPGQLIRLRMKFPTSVTLPAPTTGTPTSYNYAPGHYVWHCHILEHEEHDMMHEFELV